jgi:hypothetical protein
MAFMGASPTLLNAPIRDVDVSPPLLGTLAKRNAAPVSSRPHALRISVGGGLLLQENLTLTTRGRPPRSLPAARISPREAHRARHLEWIASPIR